jgi:hypothetical protein
MHKIFWIIIDYSQDELQELLDLAVRPFSGSTRRRVTNPFQGKVWR